MTGEIRTHNHRGHIPALCPVELRPQRPRQESNLCVGLCRPAPGRSVTWSILRAPDALHAWYFVSTSKHAVQGSNLPLPDLEAGVPPLELPAYQRHSTHGWIRTTINAINNRALYRLSYMGVVFEFSTAPLFYCSPALSRHRRDG